MIVSIIEKYQEYDIKMYSIDSTKLDPENFVDKLVMEKLKKSKVNQRLHIDCSAMTEQIENDELGISGKAKCKEAPPEKVLYLSIYFE